MAVCTGLIVANIYYIQPLIILVAHEFKIPQNVAGSATYLTQAGYAAGLLLFVPLGDMLERKKQIIATLILAIAALIAAALAHSFWMLQAACFMVGLGSIIPQLILPLSATLAQPSKRGKVIGTVMSGLLVGILLSRTLSGAIGEWLGWRSMFWIAAALCTSLTFLIYKRFPVTKPAFKGSYLSLIRSLVTLVKTQPVLRESTAISMTCFAVFGSFWTTMVLLFANAPFHFTSDKIGLFGLAGAAGALAAPLVGRFADKGNLRVTIGYGVGLYIVSVVLLYFTRENVIGCIAGIILIDVAQQSVHISNQTRIYTLIPEARNRLNTVYMTCSFTGTACGSAIGLFLWKHYGWLGVSAGNAALLFTGLAIYLLTYKRKQVIVIENYNG
ncbi:MAG TPA: MFS transporter [Chitinophagaceae bacterium]|nr:MFS transporter [Chitinophagaceae bacterium]